MTAGAPPPGPVRRTQRQSLRSAPVRHRRLASLLAAVSVAVLGAAGCGSTTAAVEVDDDSISRRDFEDQLDAVYENEAFRGALFGEVAQEQLRGEDAPRDSYTQQYVAAMAFVQVQFMVIPGVLEAEGLEVTDADRQAVEEGLESSVPGALGELPADMRDEYVEGFAGFDKLRAELDEDQFQEVLTAAISEADVTVSSRYGTWNPDDFRVDPPPGPRPAPGGGESDGTDPSAG
jgi:hypothetical protein